MTILMLFFATPATAETWGKFVLDLYPLSSSKTVAPNGLAYTPVFAIGTRANIGNPNGLYFFVDARFWAEHSNPGVTTNSRQGDFDFTKREFDLSGGLAYRVPKYRSELRLMPYSFNNLNRGVSANRPFGYKDGFRFEGLYFFPNKGRAFDMPIYVGVGYYLTRELADTSGAGYTPAFFFEGHVEKGLGHSLYAEGDAVFLTERPADAKELKTRVGLNYLTSETVTVGIAYERDFGLGSDLPDRERVSLNLTKSFYSK